MAVSSDKKAMIKHNGLSVVFEEKGHVYRVFDKDQNLKHKPVSVTTLIHKYQRPFDLEGLSAKKAAEEGVSQDEIKKRWANESRTACKHGTKMHSIAERIFNGEFVDDSTFTDKEKIVFQQINTVVGNMKNRPYDYESEKIVFDPGMNVAGTIDLLGRHKDTGDYILVDWKTNKGIRMGNEWGKTFLSPIDELPDCEFSTYALQLTMYEKILKDGGFIDADAKVRKFICHFNADTGVQFHEVGDSYKVQVDKIAHDWKKRNEVSNEGIPQF